MKLVLFATKGKLSSHFNILVQLNFIINDWSYFIYDSKFLVKFILKFSLLV